MVTLNLMVECKPGWPDFNHKPPKRDGGSKAKAERPLPAPDRAAGPETAKLGRLPQS
jgi:hypothetical protein